MENQSTGLSPEFYRKLIQISSELGFKPEDLLAVMYSESGINPSAFNPTSKAVGLVQFMPSTLKNLKYEGSPEDFKNLAAEQQLDYVKKLIEYIKSVGPLISAAHYYVGIFFPVALSLPGIKQDVKDTAFIEQNPEFVIENGKKYSKKYYDIGKKISADFEQKAYNANPLFHGAVPGAITLADMYRIVERNKSSNKYRQAVQEMQQAVSSPGLLNTSPNQSGLFSGLNNTPAITHPTSSSLFGGLDNSSPAAQPTSSSLLGGLGENTGAKPSSLFSGLESSASLKLLPSHPITIKVYSNNINNSIEFSRVLCAMLDEELESKSFTHTDGNNVEIECNIAGPPAICLTAVKELTNCAVNGFKKATQKIGGINIDTKVKLYKKSKYPPITLTAAKTNYRQFIVKFI